MLTGLLGRMYYLEIFSNHHYAKLSDKNRIHSHLLVPQRGTIVDRSGKTIANNHNVYQAVIVRDQADDWRQSLRKTGELLQINEDEIEGIAKNVSRKPKFMPIAIKDNLSWEEVALLELHQMDIQGICVEEGRNRHYPYPLQTCHILGYVASPSEKDLDGDPILSLPGIKIGKNGIEKSCEQLLRGQPGVKQVEVDASRRTIRELSLTESIPGQQLPLTIDLNLQQTIHDRLQEEKSAAVVVMEINTGNILAYCSVPGYDNNLFVNGIPKNEWRQLRDDPFHSLINKPIVGQYAPGSTFKMVVALAALHEGVIDEHTTVQCTGHVQLGTHKFHCWRKDGHGGVNAKLALGHSCDVYFYHIASLVGIDAIARMARQLGLGELTGIELPGEKQGLIPSKSWKSTVMGHGWSLGETYNASIGQGYVLSTVLQLAVMTSRLASGKKIAPHLFPQTSANYAALEISEKHLNIVREGMAMVVNEPGCTAYGSRIVKTGFEMAGKTGTSQVRRITERDRQLGHTSTADRPWHHREHALFVCYAPLDNPKYAAAVLVEHGVSGSKVAAPIGRDALLATQQILQES